VPAGVARILLTGKVPAAARRHYTGNATTTPAALALTASPTPLLQTSLPNTVAGRVLPYGALRCRALQPGNITAAVNPACRLFLVCVCHALL